MLFEQIQRKRRKKGPSLPCSNKEGNEPRQTEKESLHCLFLFVSVDVPRNKKGEKKTKGKKKSFRI